MKKSEYHESESLPMLAELRMSSAKAADRKWFFYIGFEISSEVGFWCVERSCLVNFGYDDENGTISLAIISKTNSVKKIRKNYLLSARNTL